MFAPHTSEPRRAAWCAVLVVESRVLDAQRDSSAAFSDVFIFSNLAEASGPVGEEAYQREPSELRGVCRQISGQPFSVLSLKKCLEDLLRSNAALTRCPPNVARPSFVDRGHNLTATRAPGLSRSPRISETVGPEVSALIERSTSNSRRSCRKRVLVFAGGLTCVVFWNVPSFGCPRNVARPSN
jgi:hypothetical protein